jgi:hypothetical protein
MPFRISVFYLSRRRIRIYYNRNSYSIIPPIPIKYINYFSRPTSLSKLLYSELEFYYGILVKLCKGWYFQSMEVWPFDEILAGVSNYI